VYAEENHSALQIELLVDRFVDKLIAVEQQKQQQLGGAPPALGTQQPAGQEVLEGRLLRPSRQFIRSILKQRSRAEQIAPKDVEATHALINQLEGIGALLLHQPQVR
jgi:hypothetical protein